MDLTVPYTVFGRMTADSLSVTDSAWAVFLQDVVLLEVVHPPRSAGADSAILGIIAEYKRRFGQESVLRVVTRGQASF